MSIQTYVAKFVFMVVSMIFMTFFLQAIQEEEVCDLFSVDRNTYTTSEGQCISLTKHEYLMSKSIVSVTSNIPDDVIGHADIQHEIDSVLHMLQKTTDSNSRIVEPPNGILLYGPPGTGKTSLAKQIARRLDPRKCCFMHVSADMIENKYYGEGLKQLSAIFSLAKKIKPCVLFFDEIDGIMSTRSALDQSHTNTMKTTMLTLMDSIQKEWNLLFIATTNRKDSLDPALLRRLDIQLQMSLPTTHDQWQFLQQYVYVPESHVHKQRKLLHFLELYAVGLSLSDLKNFLKFCVRQYLYQGKPLHKHKMQLTSAKLQSFFMDYLTIRTHSNF